ncbi:MAG: hypothetical protein B7C24_16385 [Bacteroidetes bacterium 4572_77]|nr:MAG: hypothetical protein B7C24_16385 [Bacteroidetes bacterium 4572_77]
MKKLAVLFFALFLSLIVISCADKSDETTEEHPDSLATIADEILPDSEVESTELDNDELPADVTETLDYQYSGAELIDVVEKNNGIEKQYKITLKHRGEKIIVNITETGKILIK